MYVMRISGGEQTRATLADLVESGLGELRFPRVGPWYFFLDFPINKKTGQIQRRPFESAMNRLEVLKGVSDCSGAYLDWGICFYGDVQYLRLPEFVIAGLAKIGGFLEVSIYPTSDDER